MSWNICNFIKLKDFEKQKQCCRNSSVSLSPQPRTNAESTEEQLGYNTYYNVPSTLNFHDIYSNSLALLAEDPVGTTSKDDKSFHLNTINTDFVEFHPKTVSPVSHPPSMNSSYIKTDSENKTISTNSTTTDEPEEGNIEVIPIKKEAYQRGLLDLLFPAARVRTFKTVFDTFRRIMSHTFR